MSPPLPSSCAGTTGRTAARGGGKLAAAAQRKREREKLLAVVARSREPASDKAHAHEHRATPATPSSVDRASRLSHRSAEKLKQQTVIASVSSVFVATPLPELPSIPEHGTDEGEGHGVRLLDLEVLAESGDETTTIAPAGQEETADIGTGDTTVRPSSMFDREAAVAFAEKAVDEDPDYVCAAGQFCRSVGDHTSSRSPCVNCNELAHHFCAEYWSEQNPVEPHLVITIKDLSKGGKIRLKNTPSAQKCDVMFCILCESRWKAMKVSAAAKIAAKKSSKRPQSSSTPPSEQRAPTKKKKASATTAPVAVIRELRRVAAFYSQVYIFTKVEKAKANLRFQLIEEHFYGNPQKRIKGACEMLLDGEGPFAALYNVVEGDFDRELVLKASCCGKATSSSYVAGVHFTVDDLYTFGVDKKVKGRQLWLMGTTVMRSVKKAISIVPKLVPSICSIDKNLAVIMYASGKTESSLMQFVDNGMFALSMNDPIDVDSDDDDNEVLGATSAKGMPLMREDVDAGQENHGFDAGSPDDILVVVDDNDIFDDGEKDDLDMVDDGEKDAFGQQIDAFGHVIAPEGYCYVGKLVFICFGPTSKYYAGTLAMGGQSDRTAEEKKKGSRKEQRKVNTDRNNMDREVGFDRGLTMQSKMQCAMMAQNEDDADQRHRDMRMMIVTKQIESTERLVELKLKTSSRMSSAGSEAQVNFAINLLMEKLEGYHGVLENMMEEKRTINPIVGNVLSMAATAMGLEKGATTKIRLAKGDGSATAIGGLEKGDDDDIEENTEDFVSDMLK
jgi:hypothetical protein